MRRRWAFEQGAPYAVIIHRAALLANSLLLSSLLDSHMLFSPEIAGNIRRPDYQKAHYFYCSFIPQMLWDGREETDAASSFPTKLDKVETILFQHLCLQKETSRWSIFSHLDFRGMAGNAPPGYLLIWTGRLTGAGWSLLGRAAQQALHHRHRHHHQHYHFHHTNPRHHHHLWTPLIISLMHIAH